MPVKTETFRELWAPLVHTNFGGNSYGPIIGPYLFLGKFVWTNGPESSSKVSPYTGIGPWMALPRFRVIMWSGMRRTDHSKGGLVPETKQKVESGGPPLISNILSIQEFWENGPVWKDLFQATLSPIPIWGSSRAHRSNYQGSNPFDFDNPGPNCLPYIHRSIFGIFACVIYRDSVRVRKVHRCS